MKIFYKTFTYTLLLMVLITVIGHGLIYLLIPKTYEQKKRNELQHYTDEIIEVLRGSPKSSIENEMQKFVKEKNVLVKLESNDGVQIYGDLYAQNVINDEERQYSFQAKESGMASEDETNTSSTIMDDIEDYGVLFPASNFMKVKGDFTDSEGNPHTLETIINLQPISEASGVILSLIPFTLVICLILSIVFSLIYSKKITDPIYEISRAANEMSKLNRNAYCELKTNDEIGILANNINHLYRTLLKTIRRLEKEIEYVGEVERSKVDFMRAASHELKTPVTALNSLLDGMAMGIGKFQDHDTYLEECKQIVYRLSEMIEEVLNATKLSTVDGKEKLSNTNLHSLVKELLGPFELIAKSKGILLRWQIPKNTNVILPIDSMTKAISNVISNAVKYTEEKKNIYIEYKDNQLIIENECNPIPMDQVDKLFEAFYRPDYSRNRNTGGNGLGLYITSRILTAYGFQYEFMPVKNGMRFIIELNSVIRE